MSVQSKKDEICRDPFKKPIFEEKKKPLSNASMKMNNSLSAINL
jgi:hypothetical protein